jgi:hypothetical protein
LTASEEEALTKFRKLLEERGYWNPGPPASHDDPTLLYAVPLCAQDHDDDRLTLHRRFLRARRWVPEDAFKQFKETEDWRVANDIDVLYRTIEIDAYEQSRRLVIILNQTLARPIRVLTILKVPSMDWPSRPSRHPRLRLRSQAT